MSKIDLQIYTKENKYVSADLPTNPSVSIEDNNPLFAREFLDGTFSLPFTLPKTGRNQRIFRFAELLHIASRPKIKLKARIFIEGLPLPDGEVILRNVGTKGYRINFQAKTSLLTTAFNGLTLKTLPFEPITLLKWDAENTHWSEANGNKYLKILVRYTTDLPNPAKVKINGEEFESAEIDDYNARMDDLIAKIQAGGYTASYVVNANPPEFDGGFYIWLTIGAPQPGLDQPLVVSASDVWEYESSWVNVWNLRIETAINEFYRDTTRPWYDVQFPTFRNLSQFSGITDSTFFQDINVSNGHDDFNKGLLQFSSVPGAPDKANRGIVPFVQFYHVMEAIQQATGIKFTGYLSYNADLLRLIFFNTHSINYFENIFNNVTITTFANVIKPAEHLPDMSVNALFTELRKLFGIGFYFDEDQKSVHFTRLSETLDSRDYLDHSKKVNPDYDFDYTEEPGILIGYKEPDDDALWNPEDKEYQLGSGADDYRTEFGYVEAKQVMADQAYVDGNIITLRYYKIPVCDEEGTAYGQEAKAAPRFLFYYQEKLDSSDKKYHFASHDNYDMQGNRLQDMSLELYGPDGLYENNFKKLANVLAYSEPLKRTLSWSMADLIRFRYPQKYRIEQVNYMLKKISIQANARSGLLPIQAELVRVD